MEELRLGDRVINKDTSSHEYGEQGKVILISNGLCLVEYDDYVADGHSGGEIAKIMEVKGKEGRCLWEFEEDLELIKRQKGNLLEKICKELNIEVGKEWVGDNGKLYMIDKQGQVNVWNDEYDQWIESYYDLRRVIIRKLKPKWKPKEGERYYSPYILPRDEDERYIENEWYDTDLEELKLEKGLVFKTKEEAIEAANKMLNVLKED